MKTYAAVIAGLALVSASAVNAQESAMPAGSESQILKESPLAAMNADDIEGKDVVDSAGKQLGDIDEVVKDQSNHMMVVIGLEDSNKEVAIPLEKLTPTSDSHTLMSSMSRQQLEVLPDYDPKDMESVEE